MKKDRILLVEDDATLSFILQDALEREGFEMECAADGEMGLRRFREGGYALVVADVMMPRLDGFEMVRRIRDISPSVPVIFLTARTSLDDVVKGFDRGGDDYVRKPFQIAELVVRIKALLRRRDAEQVEDAMLSRWGLRPGFRLAAASDGNPGGGAVAYRGGDSRRTVSSSQRGGGGPQADVARVAE